MPICPCCRRREEDIHDEDEGNDDDDDNFDTENDNSNTSTSSSATDEEESSQSGLPFTIGAGLGFCDRCADLVNSKIVSEGLHWFVSHLVPQHVSWSSHPDLVPPSPKPFPLPVSAQAEAATAATAAAAVASGGDRGNVDCETATMVAKAAQALKEVDQVCDWLVG